MSILGSTGSIGRQSLAIISHLPDVKVAARTAGTSVQRMAEQCREFLPELAVMATQEAAEQLKSAISGLPVRVAYGEAGLIEAATIASSDCVITAVVGMVGLKPTLAAIRAGKRIGLANKETMVCAGELVMTEAKAHHVEIIPVDSEHSAIFQCLMGNGQKREIKRLILTCSGGPFYGMTNEQLKKVTKADALKHPNWKMGAKITIDCATLMNKGLEVIEAKWLFDVDIEQIEVVVHPQSIIHSMVEYVDGAIIAELGTPDMKLPIQYALYYPERRYLPGERVDFGMLSQLTFEKPDLETFYGLRLAMEAGKAGGSLPTVFNAANERAVSKFLNREIAYLQIPEIIEACMQSHKNVEAPTVEEILQIEQEIYEQIESRW